MEGQVLFIGPIVHSESRECLTILENAALLIQNGQIIALEESENSIEIHTLIKDDCQTIALSKGQFLCPGFVDSHIHASQYPNVGLGYDKPLLEWLKSYTFPLEMKYKSTDFANKVYESVVKATLAWGTTTACYFATIYTESSINLARIASDLGQRALIGKVNMNQNSMNDYIETTEGSLLETEKFISAVKNIKNPLVQPVVTPRFAVSCDMALMQGLSEIAKKHDCFIQTHVSENEDEVAFVKQLFPDCKTYVDVYSKSGLLTRKTILAHGIYLSEKEKQKLSEAGTSISHCPNSNIMLKSGLCDVRSLWKHNIKVGLGTDVSGGSHISILDAMRTCIVCSNCSYFNKPQYTPLSYHEAFYMATLGGAEALGLDNAIGNFQIGKDFDALLIDINTSSGQGVFSNDIIQDVIQKFIYCGDDRNIKTVYIKGKVVKNTI